MSTIAGITYLNARFDKAGAPQDAITLPDGTTDLFVISHGWNNSAKEADELYRELFENFAAVAPELLTSRKPVVLGIIWPSKKFTEAVAAEASQGGAAGTSGDAAAADRTLEMKLEKFGELVGPKAAPEIAAAHALISRLEDDPASRDEFVNLLRGLLDPSAKHPEDASDKLFKMSGSNLLDKLQTPTVSLSSPGGGGAASRLGGAQAAPLAGGAAGLGDVFSGIKAGAIRLMNYLTYYEMKERAGSVGRKGVGPLIDQLAPSVQRIHLIGHSFGARVVTSAAAGSSTDKIRSMSLLQAAFSHNSFSPNYDDSEPPRPGFFRDVVEKKRVKGPIVITHTPNDTAVGLMYPAASRLAGQVAAAFGDKNDRFGGLGRNGAQRMGKGEVVSAVGELLPVGGTYTWEASRFHNLEASRFIVVHGGGDAHGVVTGKEVAWAISQAAV